MNQLRRFKLANDEVIEIDIISIKISLANTSDRCFRDENIISSRGSYHLKGGRDYASTTLWSSPWLLVGGVKDIIYILIKL